MHVGDIDQSLCTLQCAKTDIEHTLSYFVSSYGLLQTKTVILPSKLSKTKRSIYFKPNVLQQNTDFKNSFNSVLNDVIPTRIQ